MRSNKLSSLLLESLQHVTEIDLKSIFQQMKIMVHQSSIDWYHWELNMGSKIDWVFSVVVYLTRSFSQRMFPDVQAA